MISINNIKKEGIIMQGVGSFISELIGEIEENYRDRKNNQAQTAEKAGISKADAGKVLRKLNFQNGTRSEDELIPVILRDVGFLKKYYK